MSEANSHRLTQSWVANAEAWTDAVRQQAIASRRQGTDAAMVAAVLRHEPRRVLDVGCGEGWLCRALAEHKIEVVGIDGSAPLIGAARALGGGTFEVVSYEALAADAEVVAGPFDAIACNFALLHEDVTLLLAALRQRLAGGGHLLLQTLHPWSQLGTERYADGWREERFDAFSAATDGPAWTPMPWYFRTLGSWTDALRHAGLAAVRIEEPLGPDGRPLSLLLDAVPL